MPKEKKKAIKNKIHSRNKNKERYDLGALLKLNPKLSDYLKPNHKCEDAVDLSNPIAIKILNQTLLHYYYGIENWNFSDKNLCPTIPNKADYIHYMADVLMGSNFGNLPEGEKITCLNIGAGATCIYPIIGVTEYNWNFIASDIDSESIKSAQTIVTENKVLTNKIELRLQEKPKDVIYGALRREETIDLAICNPPFYNSIEDAKEDTQKKTAPYKASEITPEIIYSGGEIKFLKQYIKESKAFGSTCFWFSALVTKKANQKSLPEFLKLIGATEIKVIPFGLGNKSTQIIVWTFLSPTKQKEWRETKWRSKK
jgi:23S rRNA (adenine1618-N6)-methyltransferase